jgi:two-component system, chemotaxis family, sensor kinase CheA
MTDPSRIAETLKAKAMLLIQREREVYALPLGRERMMEWLRASQRLSLHAGEQKGISLCAAWTEAMLGELHFQTARAWLCDPTSRELTLIHGQSHTPLEPRLQLGEGGWRVLRQQREGSFDRTADPDLSELAQSLGLQRFLWFVFSRQDGTEILLAAGVAVGVSGAQAGQSADDLVNFAMLGRHLAVLLSNAALIDDLESASRNLQELFDHMRQAIVTFDHTGAIGGVSSSQARAFFGFETLEGRSARELLYPASPDYDVDATAFNEWVQMVFATPADEWATCEPYAPRETVITSRDGRPIPLELEFRPLIRAGKIAHVMLLATDVSVARELEVAVRTHQAKDATRLFAMRRLIAGGTQVFLAFVESVRARIVSSEALLTEHSTLLPIEVIDALFRHAHTTRSEARAFDLHELEAATQRLEEDLDELRSAARGPGYVLTGSCVGRLRSGLGHAREALELGCDMLAAAAPTGKLVFDQATVRRSTLRQLVELAANRGDPLGQLIAELVAVPFGLTAAGVLESAPDWARLQGVTVALRVEPRELMVPDALARALPGVLAHLVRNCIAHGIEPAEERERLGKPAHGTILIKAEETSLGIGVVVSDDGRGVVAGRVIERAADDASSKVDADVTELVFLPGLSTRDGQDALAGRGVGLDAARSELSRIGYDVSLSFVPGEGTKVTLTPKGRRLAVAGSGIAT